MFWLHNRKKNFRKIKSLWGVKAYYDNELSTDDTVKDINKLILEKGYVNPEI